MAHLNAQNRPQFLLPHKYLLIHIFVRSVVSSFFARWKLQCDGVSLELANGPHLQGIALLNIPYTHGGSNLWGEHLSQKRIKRGGGPFRKGKKLKCSEKELSANSFNSVDLSVAIQGEYAAQ